MIYQFEDQNDVYVNTTEGNIALIPCTPPRSDPPATVVFEVNSTTIDQSSSKS